MATCYRLIATVAILAGICLTGLTSRQTIHAAALPDAALAPAPVPAPSPCPANKSWITAPNPPQEIGGPGVPLPQETNCMFHQFAWQWFLALTQPSKTSPGDRVFETLNVFQPGAIDQCNGPKSTGKAAAAKALFVRLNKPEAATIQPVTPGELDQATGQPLYDQNGNIVFYNVFYNPTECKATSAGFQPNTIELKISWKQLKAPDPTYYTMQANLQGKQVLLGLVGFHVVINTAFHPEFVWATFEHVTNDPDCTRPRPRPAAGWSFTSAKCSRCLCQISPCNLPTCNPACGFNDGGKPIKSPPLTGKPNQVCRVYRDGTDPGPMTDGNNNDTNRFNIDTLNQQIAGYFKGLAKNDPMKVWDNYTLIGALWTLNGVGSGGPNVQRGSLELANTTMETFFQKPSQNCFTCHNYTPPPPPTNNPLTVSHIVCSLLPTSTTNCKSELLMQIKKPEK